MAIVAYSRTIVCQLGQEKAQHMCTLHALSRLPSMRARCTNQLNGMEWTLKRNFVEHKRKLYPIVAIF